MLSPSGAPWLMPTAWQSARSAPVCRGQVSSARTPGLEMVAVKGVMVPGPMQNTLRMWIATPYENERSNEEAKRPWILLIHEFPLLC